MKRLVVILLMLMFLLPVSASGADQSNLPDCEGVEGSFLVSRFPTFGSEESGIWLWEEGVWTQVVKDVKFTTDVRWNPAGDSFTYTKYEPDHMSSVYVHTGSESVKISTDESARAYGAAWVSNDMIVYGLSKDGLTYGLNIARPDGTVVTLLRNLVNVFDYEPSPDGQNIGLILDKEGYRDLAVYNISSQELTTIIGYHWIGSIMWSPSGGEIGVGVSYITEDARQTIVDFYLTDGSKLAYSFNVAGISGNAIGWFNGQPMMAGQSPENTWNDIYVRSADGRVRNLTNTAESHEETGYVSPLGNQIAVNVVTDGVVDTNIIDIWTGEVLCHLPSMYELDWNPLR